MRRTALLAVALALAIAPAGGLAKSPLPPDPLEQSIRAASFVLIGEVTRVEAENVSVRVLRTLKGDPVLVPARIVVRNPRNLMDDLGRRDWPMLSEPGGVAGVLLNSPPRGVVRPFRVVGEDRVRALEVLGTVIEDPSVWAEWILEGDATTRRILMARIHHGGNYFNAEQALHVLIEDDVRGRVPELTLAVLEAVRRDAEWTTWKSARVALDALAARDPRAVERVIVPRLHAMRRATGDAAVPAMRTFLRLGYESAVQHTLRVLDGPLEQDSARELLRALIAVARTWKRLHALLRENATARGLIGRAGATHEIESEAHELLEVLDRPWEKARYLAIG